MSIRISKGAMDGLHTLFHFGSSSGWSDEQLIAQFLSGSEGSEAAFRTVLQRHGPMVMGVCRRILGDVHAAEDAFQATFLVFVKKAGTLRERDLLTNWLYGVALRVAGKARVQAARRQAVESSAMGSTSGHRENAPEHAEIRSVIDEEIRRLPERFRVPLVLCYLEGLHHHEIAQRLGCPIGTVESRLSRARDQLRSRLARRGLAPTGAVMIALLAPSDVSAASPALIEGTIRAASNFWAGSGIEVAPSVATLVKHVLRPAASSFSLGGVSLSMASACGGILVAGLGFLFQQAGGTPLQALAAPHSPKAAKPPITPQEKAAREVALKTDTTSILDKVAKVETIATANNQKPSASILRSPSAIATPLSNIVVDGHLEDWPSDLPQIPIRTMLVGNGGYDTKTRKNGNDPEASFRVGYDRKTQLIYLAVTVPDNDQVGKAGDPWHTDAVEVYVDGDPNDQPATPAARSWDNNTKDPLKMPVLQYAGIPGTGGTYGDSHNRNPSLVYGNIANTGTQMKFQRSGEVTTYEWAIQAFDHYPDTPTRLAPGKRLGFDLAIVDKDRDRALPTWISWGPSPVFFKGVEPSNLGELILGDGP